MQHNVTRTIVPGSILFVALVTLLFNVLPGNMAIVSADPPYERIYPTDGQVITVLDPDNLEVSFGANGISEANFILHHVGFNEDLLQSTISCSVTCSTAFDAENFYINGEITLTVYEYGIENAPSDQSTFYVDFPAPGEGEVFEYEVENGNTIAISNLSNSRKFPRLIVNYEDSNENDQRQPFTNICVKAEDIGTANCQIVLPDGIQEGSITVQALNPAATTIADRWMPPVGPGGGVPQAPNIEDTLTLSSSTITSLNGVTITFQRPSTFTYEFWLVVYDPTYDIYVDMIHYSPANHCVGDLCTLFVYPDFNGEKVLYIYYADSNWGTHWSDGVPITVDIQDVSSGDGISLVQPSGPEDWVELDVCLGDQNFGICSELHALSDRSLETLTGRSFMSVASDAYSISANVVNTDPICVDQLCTMNSLNNQIDFSNLAGAWMRITYFWFDETAQIWRTRTSYIQYEPLPIEVPTDFEVTAVDDNGNRVFTFPHAANTVWYNLLVGINNGDGTWDVWTSDWQIRHDICQDGTCTITAPISELPQDGEPEIWLQAWSEVTWYWFGPNGEVLQGG